MIKQSIAMTLACATTILFSQVSFADNCQTYIYANNLTFNALAQATPNISQTLLQCQQNNYCSGDATPSLCMLKLTNHLMVADFYAQKKIQAASDAFMPTNTMQTTPSSHPSLRQSACKQIPLF